MLLAAVALRKLLAGDLRTARSWLRKSFASEHTPVSVKQPEGPSSSTVPPALHPSEAQYLQCVVKLVQYAFLSWSNSILVIGCRPNRVVKVLRDAGYNRVQSCELGDKQAARVLESRDSTYHTVILLDWVEHLGPVERDALLGQLHRLASEFVVASIPTYPEALFPLTEVQAPPTVLETRDWWDRAFSLHSFRALRQPLEDLSPLSPFLYRRDGSETYARADSGSTPTDVSAGQKESIRRQPVQPKALFLLPPQENAFLWVVRELVDELETLSFPARIRDSGRAAADSSLSGTLKITWAHFWPAYRRLAREVHPEFEVFVSNFYLERRGELSDWLAELCDRPSLKLPPSHFAKEVLVRLGVPEKEIVVLPHGYSPEFAATPEPLPLPTRKSFRFLAVVNSYDPYRYGLDLLLQAYRKGFGPKDDVCLVVKDYGRTSDLTRSLLGGAEGPEVLYYANFLPKPQLASFYAAHSAFVAPFRGEGFGMKILDATAIGLPLIMPHFAGPADYCPAKWIEPVSYQLRPVGRCLETEAFAWNEALTWCAPDVDDLATRMRRVFENLGAAREKAVRLRQHVLDRYSWRSAAQILIRALEQSGAAR